MREVCGHDRGGEPLQEQWDRKKPLVRVLGKSSRRGHRVTGEQCPAPGQLKPWSELGLKLRRGG